jgi:hypothetical protein
MTPRWFRVAALALTVPRLAAAAVLLSEIEVNPPTAADDPWEYIEIRGPDGASLAGYQVLVVDGDGGGEGLVDQVVDLGTACSDDPCALGANGLAIIKPPSGGHATPPATTVFGDPQLGVFGGGIENGTLSVLLVAGPVLFTEGNDYDANDDGTLELPPGDTIVDAVGWTDGDASDLVYGGVSLVGGGSPPDAATRFAGDDTPLTASAWYHGDLAGNASTTSYDADAVSADFPAGGRLTPGAPNEPPPVATTTTLATTTTTLPPLPVALRVAVVKPSRLFRFAARGIFPIPDPAIDDPRSEGGTLAFVGTTGGATYTLASSGWRGLGPKKDGSKGFRFAGYPCRSVVVKRTTVKGLCRRDTGTIGLPEPGPLGIVLRIGDATRYCGACGGVARGNTSVVFKRTACAAPASCP